MKLRRIRYVQGKKALYKWQTILLSVHIPLIQVIVHEVLLITFCTPKCEVILIPKVLEMQKMDFRNFGI
jgi:hypothetical protein